MSSSSCYNAIGRIITDHMNTIGGIKTDHMNTIGGTKIDHMNAIIRACIDHINIYLVLIFLPQNLSRFPLSLPPLEG